VPDLLAGLLGVALNKIFDEYRDIRRAFAKRRRLNGKTFSL
jgi:hypothetical protein